MQALALWLGLKRMNPVKGSLFCLVKYPDGQWRADMGRHLSDRKPDPAAAVADLLRMVEGK